MATQFLSALSTSEMLKSTDDVSSSKSFSENTNSNHCTEKCIETLWSFRHKPGAARQWPALEKKYLKWESLGVHRTTRVLEQQISKSGQWSNSIGITGELHGNANSQASARLNFRIKNWWGGSTICVLTSPHDDSSLRTTDLEPRSSQHMPLFHRWGCWGA